MMQRLASCERGNSFIELALAAPMFVIIITGMVDVSRGISEKLLVTQAAQRTIELVQRRGFHISHLAPLKLEAESAAGSGSNATVTAWLECGSSTTKYDYSSSCAPGQPYARYVGVVITKPFTPFFGSDWFPGTDAGGSFTLTGTAGLRVQ